VGVFAFLPLFGNALLTYSLPDDGLGGNMEINRLIPGGQALCEELASQ